LVEGGGGISGEGVLSERHRESIRKGCVRGPGDDGGRGGEK